jgi:cytoskeleton protein RodZ
MQTEQSAEHAADEADKSIDQATAGELLRQERLRRGLSEKEVADQLHITMQYVKALEADNYEKLPGTVFVKGYIKSYAILLKLEVDALLALYEDSDQRRLMQQHETARQQVRRSRDRNKPWVVISVIGFVGGFAGLWAYNNFFGDTESEPAVVTPAESDAGNALDTQTESVESAIPLVSSPVIQSVATQPVRSEASTTANRQDPLPQQVPQSDFVTALSALAEDTTVTDDGSSGPNTPASATVNPRDTISQVALTETDDFDDRFIEIGTAGDDVLRITFSGESWVEVNDGDAKQIYRDLRAAGDVLEITGNGPFNILLGDAPFTRLTFNGSDIDVSNNIRIDNSARLTVGL